MPKGKQITLIGAISEEGYVYHELLNSDGTKTKGVGAEEVSLFLMSLGSRLPRDSVIIMDNAPIHRGARFNEIKDELQKSKGIKIEFLPPYSPFLNPIEYSFHSIKAYVHAKEPKNRPELVATIKDGINVAITQEKSKKFFSHCKKFYRNCLEMQPVTGPLLAAP